MKVVLKIVLGQTSVVTITRRPGATVTITSPKRGMIGPAGPQGPVGPPGPAGTGLPTGGTTGQVMRKASNTNYDFEYHSLVKSDVGLSAVPNVDATSRANHTGTQSADTIVDGGTNKVFTATEQTKLAGVEASADVTDSANVGSSINGTTAKVTPIDGDYVPIIDSAASNVLKKLSWANIKTTLKTYFDPLYAAVSHTHSESDVTNLTTDLAGKQPLDTDLTAIAALTPSNDDIIQRKAGAWTNRTTAQLKSDLALTKSDVGLSNVDNTADVDKPVSTAMQAALDEKSPIDSPTFTGTPAAPTPTVGDNSTKLATTEYVETAVASVSGGVTDGDKGDITVSGSGSIWTVDSGAIGYGKIQNVSATDKLLGRSTAGAGVIEEIPLTAAGRALIDDVDAAAQRTTLGLGSVATLSSIDLTTNVTGTLAVANGGTGATTASAARTALGLAIGSNVQAWDATLDALAGLSATGFVAVGSSGSAASSRTLTAGSAKISVTNGNGSAGNPTVDLGSVASTDLSDGSSLYKSGGTDVAVADGGTGASTASGARTNLGLVINTDVQAYSANLTTVAGQQFPLNASVADNSWSGMTITMTGGEAGGLVFGDVCYIKSDGKMGKADADAIATASALFVCLATIANNATGSFGVGIGVLRNDTAFAWTPGGPIYLSTTTGAMTQTAPSGTDDVIQIMGVALTADVMLFKPELVQVEHT